MRSRLKIWLAVAAAFAGVAGLVPVAVPVAAAPTPPDCDLDPSPCQPCLDIVDGSVDVAGDPFGTRTVTVQQRLAGPQCAKTAYTAYVTADAYVVNTDNALDQVVPLQPGAPVLGQAAPASGDGYTTPHVFTLTVPDDDAEVCVWATVEKKRQIWDVSPAPDKCVRVSLAPLYSPGSGGGTYWK